MIKLKIFAVAMLSLMAISWTPPKHSQVSYVTDLGNNLSPSAEASIDRTLRALEDSTKAQGAVLTVPTLEGMDKQQFATETFKSWGVGDKDLDNGFLLLVCVPERKWFCATGYGLESYLTDTWISGYLKDRITPMFKAGEDERAISTAVTEISARISRGAKSGEVSKTASKTESDPFPWWLLLAWLGGIGLAAFIAFMIHREIHRRREAAEAAEALAREIKAMNETIANSSAWIRSQRPVFETSVGRLYPDSAKSTYRARFDSMEKSAQEYIATLTKDNTDDLFEKREVTARLEKYKSSIRSLLKEMDELVKKANEVRSFDADRVRIEIDSYRSMTNRAEEARRNVNSRWPSRRSDGNSASLVSNAMGSYETHRRAFDAALLAGEWDRAKSCISGMTAAAKEAKAAVEGPVILEQSLANAAAGIPARLSALQDAVQATRRAKRGYSGSNSSLASQMSTLEQSAERLSTSAKSAADPLHATEQITDLISSLNSVASKWKQLESDRLRKIREEEEEEERRRRSSSSGSSYIGFDIGSSSSSSSSSSDFGGFGGGDSGGGGGGGDW